MSDLVLKAAKFAREKHSGQVRKHSGLGYIQHPMRVAGNVSLHPRVTEPMVAAAWLHDVVEDCGVTHEEVHDSFGYDIYFMVYQLTNPSKGSKESRADRKKMDREHLKRASWSAKIIKMEDRIDNLLDMSKAKEDFKHLYVSESLLLLEVIGDADSELRDRFLLACGRLLGNI